MNLDDLERRAKHCVSHNHGCDCREWKLQSEIAALKSAKVDSWLKIDEEIKAQNDALKTQLAALNAHIDAYEKTCLSEIDLRNDEIATLKRLVQEMEVTLKEISLDFDNAYVNEGDEINKVVPVCNYCKGIGIYQGGPNTIVHSGSCIVGRSQAILNRLAALKINGGDVMEPTKCLICGYANRVGEKTIRKGFVHEECQAENADLKSKLATVTIERDKWMEEVGLVLRPLVRELINIPKILNNDDSEKYLAIINRPEVKKIREEK